MADQIPAPAPTPAPAAPAPAAPAANDPVARMRAHAGLPPKAGQPGPKAAPAPSSAAPPAGTPPAPTTDGSDPKPTEQPGDKPAGQDGDQGDKKEGDKPEEPKQSAGALALQLVREQKARQAAEKKAAELEARLQTGEGEAAPIKGAKEKWAAGKFAEAIREAFGVKNFSDDFLVQLASSDAEPEPMTQEQLTEHIRQQLKDEMKREADAQAARIAELRGAAVEEVGAVLTKSPDRWPTVWRFGVTGEQLAAAMDASFDPRTGRTATAEQIFDKFEADYRKEVEGLPYWQRQEAAPAATEPPPPAAPRSFGSESRRGPVPTTEAKPPTTAEERWAAREKAEREFRQRHFGSRN